MCAKDLNSNGKPTVFVSFNYKSSNFVDSLEKKIKTKANVVRYEDGIKAWGSFTDFMNTIKEQDFAVLVISESYLKSSACMYEVLQLMQDEDWQNKTMFAIMADGNSIYNEEGRIEYICHWASACSDLEKKIETMPGSATQQQRNTLEQWNTIRDQMGIFLKIVADTKNPPLFDVIDEICKRVDISTRSRFKVEVPDRESISMRSWYILELIRESDGITVHEIAKKSGLTVSTTTRLLRNLQNEGLITEQKRKMQENRSVRVFRSIA